MRHSNIYIMLMLTKQGKHVLYLNRYEHISIDCLKLNYR
jgi:hypothetical protein